MAKPRGSGVFKKMIEGCRKVLGANKSAAELEQDVFRARVERAAKNMEKMGRLRIRVEPRWFRS